MTRLEQEILNAREGLPAGIWLKLNSLVDEGLIGGITVRIGDQLYDASVRNRLERLRARLTAV